MSSPSSSEVKKLQTHSEELLLAVPAHENATADEPAASLAKLPTELIIEIAQLLKTLYGGYGNRTICLKPFSSTNKRIRAICLKVLFRQITLDLWHSRLQVCSFIRGNASTKDLVKACFLNEVSWDIFERNDDNLQEYHVGRILETMKSLTILEVRQSFKDRFVAEEDKGTPMSGPSLPAIKTLIFHGYRGLGMSTWTAACPNVNTLVVDICNKSRHGDNTDTDDTRLWVQDSVQKLCSLRTLKLRYSSRDKKSFAIFAGSQLHGLTRLVIFNDVGFILEEITFNFATEVHGSMPNLRELAIGDFKFVKRDEVSYAVMEEGLARGFFKRFASLETLSLAHSKYEIIYKVRRDADGSYGDVTSTKNCQMSDYRSVCWRHIDGLLDE